jgi:AcrR family transcriptional regulator
VLKRRERILTEAARLFAVNGFTATTMSEVVAAVGGSKATLYRHFPSKEALLRATLERLGQEQSSKLGAILDRSAPIEDRIRAFCRDYLQHSVRPDVIDFRRLFQAESGRSDIGRKVYEDTVVPAWSRIAAALADAMEAGALRRADPWRTAMHLKSLAEGYLPELLVADAIDRVPATEILALADEAADIFLRAFGPRRERP